MMTILLRIPDNSKIYIENCINSPSQYVQNQIKTKSFQITNDTKFNILNRFFKIWMSVQCYIEFDMFISIGSYFQEFKILVLFPGTKYTALHIAKM